eukprot:TRINITY_DN74_c0_g1_i2.p5 TRINITY_DN74_c0_g1~~TRINITY_DN74_c0_g1_i2.p5  ORF type:complete len:104 (+),score=1.74 TRINITY_DN74_c0_g1_i2:1745-2056(+)
MLIDSCTLDGHAGYTCQYTDHNEFTSRSSPLHCSNCVRAMPQPLLKSPASTFILHHVNALMCVQAHTPRAKTGSHCSDSSSGRQPWLFSTMHGATLLDIAGHC